MHDRAESRWRELGKQIAGEYDPQKLLPLHEELCAELEALEASIKPPSKSEAA